MTWEARRCRRYGSEHVGHFATEEDATRLARKEIKDAGSHGRITYRDSEKRVLYFDICAEET